MVYKFFVAGVRNIFQARGFFNNTGSVDIDKRMNLNNDQLFEH